MNTDTSVTKKTTKVFFPNLNGVRAIAALLVVVAHIEYHKANFNIPRINGINLSNLGKVGVTIFFALSGFLITYLLLEERKNYKKINFGAFYVRRILRIWPLYFLVLFFGFFVYPGHTSSDGLWLSVFFLPNLAFCLSKLPALFDTIWSIGTEEQFYIFHPLFFRIKDIKHILHALLLFLVLFYITDVLIKVYYHGIISQLFYYIRFDNMVVGAIVAVVYFNTKNKAFDFKFQGLFDILFTKLAQRLLLVIFIVFVWIYITWLPPQGDLLIAILSALLIVNLCETSTSNHRLDNRSYQYIGGISYGVYLLHKFPLFLVLYMVRNHMAGTPLLVQNTVIYMGSFAGAVGLASASYYGYERYFLTFKKRFQRITQ